MADRKLPPDYHEIARVRGAVWLGPEARNANTRTEWRCLRCTCRWWAIYNSLRRGSACPVCGVVKRSRSQAKAPADYHRLAEARGLVWLGPVVPRTSEKTGWGCASGHSWMACYNKISWGRGCPECARQRSAQRSRAQRHPPEMYHTLATSRDLAWCGPEVTSANTKTRWACSRAGHRWRATYNKINQGRGCPRCAVRRRADHGRHRPEAYHVLAAGRGFRWAGPTVRAVDRKTWWRCAKGHSWRATYNMIQQGHGCHTCKDYVNGRLVSQTQRRLCRSLGGRLNHRVGVYAIDVVIEIQGIRVAVEFDSWYYHGGREAADACRDRMLLDAGWRVLRIRSPGALPTRGQLHGALQRIVEGATHLVVTLPGWGEGPTLASRRRP